jgi:hypothetical protein
VNDHMYSAFRSGLARYYQDRNGEPVCKECAEGTTEALAQINISITWGEPVICSRCDATIIEGEDTDAEED